MSIFRKLLFLTLMLSTALGDIAADNRYVFRHYTVDNGLPYNGVRAICQDRYGFMWFGLDNGLCRYDGVRMKTFRHNKKTVDQFVSALLPNDTCLWIGTSHGLTRMRFSDESFQPFSLKTKAGVGITSNILCITADTQGRLWISSQGQGVFCYDGTSQRLTLYPETSTGETVSLIVNDRNGGVWVVPKGGQTALYHLDKGSGRFQRYAPPCPYDLSYEVSAMIIDSRGRKWLGTRRHGLVCIAADGTVSNWLTDINKIHSILEVRPERFLVGSDDGLTVLDTSTGRTERYEAQTNQEGALSDRFVYPLVLDHEGGIWIGTFYGGINYVSPSSGRFKGFVHRTDHNSIGGNVINNFAEDRNGRIWIASDDGGLSRLEPKEGRIVRFSLGDDKLASENVHGLWADDDCVWVGTYTSGLYRIGYDGSIRRRYSTYKSSRPVADANSCYSLFRDSRGVLWCGSLESICRYNPQLDCFELANRTGELVIDINEDRQGNLWFATQGEGLFFLSRSGKWRHFSSTSHRYTVPDNNINSILVDSHGQVIIATKAGLSRYDNASQRFVDLGISLSGVEATAVVEDADTYWITTVNGMMRYRRGEEPQWFNKNDGLQSNQFFPNAMLHSSDGTIYVGTNFGFNAFQPSEIVINKNAPTVAITGLYILNKPVETGSDILQQAINHTRRIDLSHGDNVFTLLFACQSYCTPENNKYAYRLDGFDKDWNYVGKATQATYTNLSPGTYTFRVKAANNDGTWSHEEATVKIVVHPPFFLSTPMKILYFLFIVAMAMLVVRWLLRRAERRHARETERLKAEKEREVRDAKIGFFTMIAHEIRTPVSLIIGPLENILKNTGQMPKAVSDDLDIIDRNAHRLLYLVNQLLDFRKVEQKSLVTHFTLCNISNIVKSVGERFKPTFAQKNIEFSVVCDDDNLSAVVDSEAITKVVSNLLTNAVKYGHSKVALACCAAADGQSFIITVSDDGRGVREEDRERIFRPFFQAVDNKPGTGIGLSIVKNIVDRHNGTITVDSAPADGSVFTVTIPLSHPDAVIGESVEIEAEATEQSGTEQYTVQTPTADNGERLTVLIVEDNVELLNFITNKLKASYNVITAHNGMEAFDTVVKHGEINLVVSDWMMPRMDGDELCRRIRADKRVSHLPFILLTAKTDSDSKIEGLRCGADSYIEKPFSMQYLLERINNLISMRRLLQQKFSATPLAPLKSIATTALDDDFLNRMQQLIEENFSNSELSVPFLAERMGISRSSMFAKIKSLSGMTPNDMIMLVRLKRAAGLLKEHKYQISEICYMVGFGNPSYFSKCFKKQFGITPMEFVSNEEE